MEPQKTVNAVASFLRGGRNLLDNLALLLEQEEVGDDSAARITDICLQLASMEVIPVTKLSQIDSLVYLKDTYGWGGAALVMSEGGDSDAIREDLGEHAIPLSPVDGRTILNANVAANVADPVQLPVNVVNANVAADPVQLPPVQLPVNDDASVLGTIKVESSDSDESIHPPDTDLHL